MTTTDTTIVTAPDEWPTPNRDEPATYIPGIADTGEGEYAVAFTLYLEADSPEQASERAMRMRQLFVDGVETSTDVFFWHLHDHDGC